MTKEKLNEIMQQYNIHESELDDVFSFVADLFYVQARTLEEKGQVSIRELDMLYDTSREIDYLKDYILDMED